MKKIKITPETYQKMEDEFREEGLAFSITIPTQEQIDEWQSQISPHIGVVHEHDMVAEMWAEHNRIEEERKLQLELDL